MPLLVLMLLALAPAEESDWAGLQVGHWVRIRGTLGDDGQFLAAEVEVLDPEDEEVVVGTVTDAVPAEGRFTVLGLTMHVSARTEWEGITIEELVGRQVKVEGHLRGPRKFSAREVTARKDAGRDRLEGRLDQLAWDGDVLRLEVLGRSVAVDSGAVVLEAEQPLDAYALAPARLAVASRTARDDDDDLPGTLALGESLSFGGQLEWKTTREDDLDLDRNERSDRLEQEASLRGELVWEPDPDVFTVLGFRQAWQRRADEGEPTEREPDGSLTEAYGYFKDTFGAGVDLAVGRQDFDDSREWLYDENLDAVRLLWRAQGVRLDLSASTVLADGGPRNRETDNFMAYLSNDDPSRHLAAYVIDRRRSGDEVREKPIHLGLRALGGWIEDHELWADVALLRGYGETDYRGWGLDVGTTWSPPALDPVYLTVGFAHGSGDDDPDDDVDGSFRQTGLQDNNGRFGGVTSFRYYGEVVDPELTNLSIATLGVGSRLSRRASLDLVAHTYHQDVARDRLGSSGLSARPDGDDRDLGWGLDLILGYREWTNWDLEVVVGHFEPGAAFPAGAEEAWLGKLQLRYRF